ncbi:MAG: glycosyltransferase [Planctomycetaceae bacterium]|nr:glycosyltransferase [Planctomycetaceae bacterium]
MEPSQNVAQVNECPLTVVLIGRNEEQFIGGAIESVLAAKSRIPGLEVIFVDSASTDRSIEVAQQHPIRILQLRKNWPLCVAAGRYIGYLHSHGKYIFFQDGDSNVNADWLVEAVEFMESHPEFGGIAGVLDEEYVDAAGVHSGGVPNVFQQDLSKDIIEIKHLGGIALYRREAMVVAGPVNPHLPTAEDHELCMRIRNAGYKLARIKGRMAVKFTENRQTLHEILRRSRTKMFDYGAVIRYAGQYGCAWQFSVESISYVISFCLALLLFLIAIPVSIYFQVWWILAIGLVAVIVVTSIKKGGVHGAALSIAGRAASTYRTFVSYWKTKPKSIAEYPTDAIQVK